MGIPELRMTVQEEQAVAEIKKTIEAAKQIHPQVEDVYAWVELIKYIGQVGAPREQVAAFIADEWEETMDASDWQIYKLMARLMATLQPVVAAREETNLDPEYYIDLLSRKALGEDGIMHYRPDSPKNMRRRGERLKEQVKALEESQKVSWESLNRPINI